MKKLNAIGLCGLFGVWEGEDGLSMSEAAEMLAVVLALILRQGNLPVGQVLRLEKFISSRITLPLYPGEEVAHEVGDLKGVLQDSFQIIVDEGHATPETANLLRQKVDLMASSMTEDEQKHCFGKMLVWPKKGRK